MSVIGIGKAARDIDRAAKQARERRDGFERAEGSSELPEVEGTVACASCGADTPRADVMYGEAGALCSVCFGQRASEAAVAELPDRWGRLARRLGRAAVVWSVALAFVGWAQLPPTGIAPQVGWLLLLVWGVVIL